MTVPWGRGSWYNPRMLTPLRFRVPALLAACVAWSCKSSAPPACLMGATRACDDAGECAAQQICSGTPAQWGPCECLSVQGQPPKIGEACTTDGSCANDEICLDGSGASFLGGVPVEGTCVLPCTEDPSVCDDLSRPGVCVVTDDNGTARTDDDVAHCFERCDVAGIGAGKCHDREKVACSTLVDRRFPAASSPAGVDAGLRDDAAFCRPLCSTNDDCPTGECDLGTGVCVARAPGGQRLGTRCDPDETPTACAGACITFEGVSFCSHRCKFGSSRQCGDEAAGDAGATLDGLCRFPEDHGGLGDTAFCGQLCDCDADCVHPQVVCSAFADLEIEAITGHLGVCLPARDAAGDTRPGLSCQ